MCRTLVIIVTYNGMKWLERCLDSVVNSSIPLDAYIVDNGSTDGSQQFITANYPQFTFYQSPTNSGFGAANNIGLKYAVEHNYDYVYLLNQDAWVEADTIEVLIKHQKKSPEYGILSPLQTNAEMNMLDKNFAAACAKNREIFSDYVLGQKNKTLYDVNFVMAAHWLISRECLLKVGVFSPVFYHYGEDDNYIHRAKYHNFRIGVATDALGVHDREYRETSKEKAIYMIVLPFLIISSNINYPLFLSIVKAYIKTIYSAIIQSYKYRDIFILLKYIFRIYPIYNIYRDRKRNMISNTKIV
ncbi:MAG: glycosyltransferase [Rikenellaceae bacterium]